MAAPAEPASTPVVDLLARVRDPLSADEKQLLVSLVPERLPRHVAIIMDGNGRWAKSRGLLERIRGHEAGTTSVRQAVRACAELHLHALTLYCFSVENWQRPAAEISALMALLKRFLVQELRELQDNNVRLVASGLLERLPLDVLSELKRSMEATAHNTGLTLNLALSYGGRQEITRAVQELARDVAAGRIAPENITEDCIAARLYQPDLGDPDLLIRTSGEMRVSNFLLWQIAYSEIHVTPVYWPEFRRFHLYQALADYQGRDRRFGKVSLV